MRRRALLLLTGAAVDADAEPDPSTMTCGDWAAVAGCGDPACAWEISLFRTSPIGFAQQVGTVTAECIDGSASWCYGTGWDTTALFAPDRANALRAIDDVRAILDAVAP